MIEKNKICDYCGKEYKPSRISQRFCCNACYRKWNNSHKKGYERKIQAKKYCEICGKIFVPLKHNQRTCSVDCRTILQKQTKKKYDDKKKKEKAKNFITIDDVARYQMRHKEKTGEWLSYTEAVKRLENIKKDEKK